jgi:Fe-S cluster assembly iron-binding protein IscA
MIQITPAAKTRIKEILAKNPGKYFRLVVEGDGCAGPYLSLFLDEANSNENTSEIDGIEILISDEVKRHAEITTIDIFVNQVKDDLLR